MGIPGWLARAGDIKFKAGPGRHTFLANAFPLQLSRRRRENPTNPQLAIAMKNNLAPGGAGLIFRTYRAAFLRSDRDDVAVVGSAAPPPPGRAISNSSAHF